MSRYTTEFRWLQVAGADLGLNDYPIYDENYRAILNKKIMDHFYFYEIGAESVDRFIFNLKTTMAEIMPLYNLYYESALLTFDPLSDYKVTESSTKDLTGGGSATATQTDDKLSVDSDTPAGLLGIADIKTNAYASAASREDNSIVNSSSTTGSSLETYAKTVIGNRGLKNYSQLLQDFRKTFINIDQMIIKELSTCFMQIY